MFGSIFLIKRGGEFVFGVEEGYWVEGGKIRHRVRDANLLGVGPEVLRSIDRLGWDIGWGVGTWRDYAWHGYRMYILQKTRSQG